MLYLIFFTNEKQDRSCIIQLTIGSGVLTFSHSFQVKKKSFSHSTCRIQDHDYQDLLDELEIEKRGEGYSFTTQHKNIIRILDTFDFSKFVLTSFQRTIGSRQI